METTAFTRAHARSCRTMHFPIHKPNGKRSVKHHHLRRLCNDKLQDHAVKGHTKRRPSPPHPAHVLSSGMLWRNQPWNVGKVTICLDCERDLFYPLPIICGLVRYHGWPRLVARRERSCNGMIWDNRLRVSFKRSECHS